MLALIMFVIVAVSSYAAGVGYLPTIPAVIIVIVAIIFGLNIEIVNDVE